MPYPAATAQRLNEDTADGDGAFDVSEGATAGTKLALMNGAGAENAFEISRAASSSNRTQDSRAFVMVSVSVRGAMTMSESRYTTVALYVRVVPW